MARVLYSDLVEGSGLTTLKNGGTRDVRSFFVDQIEGGEPATFRLRALATAGLPGPNDPHPGNPNLKVTQRLVRPAGPAQAFVQIVYEAKELGGVPLERLAVRDTVTFSSDTTQRSPLGRVLKIYEGPTVAQSNSPKTATVSYPQPMRNRVLYGLFNTRRPAFWPAAVRCVNRDPFMGFPEAYWLCTYYDEQWSDVDRKYRVTVGFTTKQTEDWSSYAFWKMPNGEFKDIPDNVYDQVKAAPYRLGTIWNTNGIGKFGLYQLADFAGIFNSFLSL